MSDYLVIDAHVHTYPTAEMGRRDVEILGALRRSGGHSGSIDDTLLAMEKDGVFKAVVANWLPVAQMRDAAMLRLPIGLPDYAEAMREIDAGFAGRIERRNQWTCDMAKAHPELFALISVDSVMNPQQMRAEVLDKAKSHGAKGLKIQFAGQRLFPFDRRLWPAYEAAQELDLALLVHSGRSESLTQYAEPKYFGEVLLHFPKLRLVLAHVGADLYDQAKAVASRYPHVSFDCSDVLNPTRFQLSDADLVSLFRVIGVERIMFGSDFPFDDRRLQMERLFRLDLTEQEKRLIAGENALRIYRLD